MINTAGRYSVDSTWAANDDSVTLQEIISLEEESTSEWLQLNEDQIGQLDQEETFSPLQLRRQKLNDPCSLRISLDDSAIKITKVVVISEGRIIEVYGNYGEYLSTEKASFLGCLSGKNFYIAQTNISANELTLKFCDQGDTLSLYGISLLVSHQTLQPSTCNSNIDFGNVERILRTSNIQLTENAVRAKEFIMNYKVIKKNEQSDDSGKLQNLLEKWNSLGCGSSTSWLSKLNLSPTVPYNENNRSLIIAENGNEENNRSLIIAENGNEENEKNISNLKNYIDLQLQQLEERMKSSLQLQLKEFEQKQNEKLDIILHLLKKEITGEK